MPIRVSKKNLGPVLQRCREQLTILLTECKTSTPDTKPPLFEKVNQNPSIARIQYFYNIIIILESLLDKLFLDKTVDECILEEKELIRGLGDELSLLGKATSRIGKAASEVAKTASGIANAVKINDQLSNIIKSLIENNQELEKLVSDEVDENKESEFFVAGYKATCLILISLYKLYENLFNNPAEKSSIDLLNLQQISAPLAKLYELGKDSVNPDEKNAFYNKLSKKNEHFGHRIFNKLAEHLNLIQEQILNNIKTSNLNEQQLVNYLKEQQRRNLLQEILSAEFTFEKSALNSFKSDLAASFLENMKTNQLSIPSIITIQFTKPLDNLIKYFQQLMNNLETITLNIDWYQEQKSSEKNLTLDGYLRQLEFRTDENLCFDSAPLKEILSFFHDKLTPKIFILKENINTIRKNLNFVTTIESEEVKIKKIDSESDEFLSQFEFTLDSKCIEKTKSSLENWKGELQTIHKIQFDLPETKRDQSDQTFFEQQKNFLKERLRKFSNLQNFFSMKIEERFLKITSDIEKSEIFLEGWKEHESLMTIEISCRPSPFNDLSEENKKPENEKTLEKRIESAEKFFLAWEKDLPKLNTQQIKTEVILKLNILKNKVSELNLLLAQGNLQKLRIQLEKQDLEVSALDENNNKIQLEIDEIDRNQHELENATPEFSESIFSLLNFCIPDSDPPLDKTNNLETKSFYQNSTQLDDNDNDQKEILDPIFNRFSPEKTLKILSQKHNELKDKENKLKIQQDNFDVQQPKEIEKLEAKLSQINKKIQQSSAWSKLTNSEQYKNLINAQHDLSIQLEKCRKEKNPYTETYLLTTQETIKVYKKIETYQQLKSQYDKCYLKKVEDEKKIKDLEQKKQIKKTQQAKLLEDKDKIKQQRDISQLNFDLLALKKEIDDYSLLKKLNDKIWPREFKDILHARKAADHERKELNDLKRQNDVLMDNFDKRIQILKTRAEESPKLKSHFTSNLSALEEAIVLRNTPWQEAFLTKEQAYNNFDSTIKYWEDKFSKLECQTQISAIISLYYQTKPSDLELEFYQSYSKQVKEKVLDILLIDTRTLLDEANKNTIIDISQDLINSIDLLAGSILKEVFNSIKEQINLLSINDKNCWTLSTDLRTFHTQLTTLSQHFRLAPDFLDNQEQLEELTKAFDSILTTLENKIIISNFVEKINSSSSQTPGNTPGLDEKEIIEINEKKPTLIEGIKILPYHNLTGMSFENFEFKKCKICVPLAKVDFSSTKFVDTTFDSEFDNQFLGIGLSEQTELNWKNYGPTIIADNLSNLKLLELSKNLPQEEYKGSAVSNQLNYLNHLLQLMANKRVKISANMALDILSRIGKNFNKDNDTEQQLIQCKEAARQAIKLISHYLEPEEALKIAHTLITEKNKAPYQYLSQKRITYSLDQCLGIPSYGFTNTFGSIIQDLKEKMHLLTTKKNKESITDEQVTQYNLVAKTPTDKFCKFFSYSTPSPTLRTAAADKQFKDNWDKFIAPII